MSQIELDMTRNSELVAVLFLDVKGYTDLGTDQQYGLFFSTVLPQIAKTLASHKPFYRNSWGDAIVCIFRSPVVAAECALALRDMFRNEEWTQTHGFRVDLQARLGLHAGTVWVGTDPIQEREGVAGYNVNLAARIEPQTTPNEVWASEVFVNLLQQNKPQKIKAIDLGSVPLAKNWGTERLYRLIRKGESDELVHPIEESVSEDIKKLLRKAGGTIGETVYDSLLHDLIQAAQSHDVYEDLRLSLHVEPLSSTSPWTKMCYRFTASFSLRTYLHRPYLLFMAYLAGPDGAKPPPIGETVDFSHCINVPGFGRLSARKFRELFKVRELGLQSEGRKVAVQMCDTLSRKHKCYLVYYEVRDAPPADRQPVKLRFAVETVINKSPERLFYSFDKLTSRCLVNCFVHGDAHNIRVWKNKVLTTDRLAEPYRVGSHGIEYEIDGPTLPESEIGFAWEYGPERRRSQ